MPEQALPWSRWLAPPAGFSLAAWCVVVTDAAGRSWTVTEEPDLRPVTELTLAPAEVSVLVAAGRRPLSAPTLDALAEVKRVLGGEVRAARSLA